MHRLPSQSLRIRLLLYLSEGTSLGAVVPLIVVFFADMFLVDTATRSVNSAQSVVATLVLLGVFIAFLRGLGIDVVGLLTRLDDSDEEGDDSPAFRDWLQTRQWVWVGVLAFASGGVLLGVAAVRWGWPWGVFVQEARLLLFGVFLVGFVGRAVIFYRIDTTTP